VSATPNLGLAHILASQSSKELTANQAFDGLDEAIAGTTTLDVTAGGTFTLTQPQWIDMRLKLTGTPGAGVNVVVPLANPKLYIVDNECGQNATVKGSSGASVTVPTGTLALLYCDGTNVLQLLSGVATAITYDLGIYLAGVYTAGQKLVEYTMPRGINYPSSMTGSYAKCDTAPTGAVDCPVKKNGSSLGNIHFAASATTGSFTGFSSNSFAAGDIVEIDAPASADASFAGLFVTLVGTKT
jgi:hypothetical protein